MGRLRRFFPKGGASGRIGALVFGALVFAIGFLPLFGGPGYEQALASGLLGPSAAGVATAVGVARGRTSSPLHAVGRGALVGIAYALVAVASSLVHAARVGLCELWGALLYFVLTAGAGIVVGGVWGAVAGEIALTGKERGRISRPRLWATLLALGGPLSGVGVSLWRYWSSPMVFAFDPFVGFFSGVLFDTVIDGGSALLTYRLGTACTMAFVALAGSILLRGSERLVLDLRTTEARARGALALLFGALSAANTLSGVSLGHFSTSESIVRDLGAEKHGARCDIVYPSTTREQEANLLLKDCEDDVAAVEARLGGRGPERIRAFFFRDEVDKKRLMGAAHTYIAKPWRREVYLQILPYPHPVLAHELAHVIAGEFGRGPFRIAGSGGGWLPNPGLVEGIAVAAAPDDEDLTDAQWARAMMQIGILPPMKRVFSLRFFGDASAKSYTLAGAFVTWVGDTWGMDAVRRWYAGEAVEDVTGKGWPELDAGFRQYLTTVPLPAEAESFARARFNRPGLFGRRCPHVVDAIRSRADVCRDTQRYEEAIRLYGEALAMDPLDHAAVHARAVTYRRRVDPERGRAELEAIARREDVPRIWRDRAEEALADAELVGALDLEGAAAGGPLASAAARYAKLAAASLEEDAARTLEVKKLAAEDPAARMAVAMLLLGDAKHGADPFVGGVALGAWRETDGARSPLALYLIGRNFVTRGFYEKGAAALDDALVSKAPMPTPRIARESLRQRMIAACALGDRAALARVKGAIDGPDDPFQGAAGGRRAGVLRQIERCAR